MYLLIRRVYETCQIFWKKASDRGYAEARVGTSHGRLDDDNGQSFRRMLELGLKSNVPIVQLATWNDWGEGTQIEPSREFG
ncbi:MAG: hypothetical protein ACE361_01650 [Aureliella sp.]